MQIGFLGQLAQILYLIFVYDFLKVKISLQKCTDFNHVSSLRFLYTFKLFIYHIQNLKLISTCLIFITIPLVLISYSACSHEYGIFLHRSNYNFIILVIIIQSRLDITCIILPFVLFCRIPNI